WITGLQFAVEWGVIAFVLNYIPYIGPFVATLFPTLLESWPAVSGHVRRSEHYTIRGRQLCRTARGRSFALDVANGRAVRDLLLDLPVGALRHLHRGANRARHPQLLRSAPVQPLGCRSAG